MEREAKSVNCSLATQEAGPQFAVRKCVRNGVVLLRVGELREKTFFFGAKVAPSQKEKKIIPLSASPPVRPLFAALCSSGNGNLPSLKFNVVASAELTVGL